MSEDNALEPWPPVNPDLDRQYEEFLNATAVVPEDPDERWQIYEDDDEETVAWKKRGLAKSWRELDLGFERDALQTYYLHDGVFSGGKFHYDVRLVEGDVHGKIIVDLFTPKRNAKESCSVPRKSTDVLSLRMGS